MAKKSRAEASAELAALAPGRRDLPVKVYRADGSKITDDETVTVVEMSIMQVARVVGALAPIREAIAADPSIWQLVADYPEEACAAIGVAIDWPGEKVGRLGSSSFDRVLAAVLEINRDFFAQLLVRVATGVPAAAVPVATPRPTNGAGETPPHSSASMAASPTPSASH